MSSGCASRATCCYSHYCKRSLSSRANEALLNYSLRSFNNGRSGGGSSGLLFSLFRSTLITSKRMKGGFSSLTRAAAAKEEDKDKDEEGGVTMKKNKNTTNNTHQLITFFKFTALSNAEDEVDAHREFIETNNLEIRGRIYLNEQGVNAQTVSYTHLRAHET